MITIQANALISGVHDRMPVVLEAKQVPAWRDPRTGKEAAFAFLRPGVDGVLIAYRDRPRVNSVSREPP